MKRLSCILVVMVVGLGSASEAAADNCNDVSAAVAILVGGLPRTATIDATCTSRWYMLTDFQLARSYSVYVDSDAASLNPMHPLVEVFDANTPGTVVQNSDTSESDPVGGSLARVSWMRAGPNEAADVPLQSLRIKISKAPDVPTGLDFSFRVRVVETTMSCPWWFLAGDYNAFSLVRNTTRGTIHSVWIWRDLGGRELARTAHTFAGNEGAALNARDFVPQGTVNGTVLPINGTIEIVHDGALDALVGSTTTLSAGTGLSFDAPFVRLPTY